MSALARVNPRSAVFPIWVLAVVIGVVGGWKVFKFGPSVTGSQTYSITFYMYAAMITSGFLTHSVFLVECGAAPVTQVMSLRVPLSLSPPPLCGAPQGFVYTALTDSSLTSCIAISFIFNGLVDLRLMSERKPWPTYVTVSPSVVQNHFSLLQAADVGNLRHHFHPGVWKLCQHIVRKTSSLSIYNYDIYYVSLTGRILYKGSIIVSCPIYLLCQLVVLLHMSERALPLLYLSAAGLVGGVSFILFTEYLCLLCDKLGAWSIEASPLVPGLLTHSLSLQSLWYYGSDLAMFFILMYVIATRKSLARSPSTEKPALEMAPAVKIANIELVNLKSGVVVKSLCILYTQQR